MSDCNFDETDFMDKCSHCGALVGEDDIQCERCNARERYADDIALVCEDCAREHNNLCESCEEAKREEEGDDDDEEEEADADNDMATTTAD